jgi:gamma-glutamylcysteine synthetase
MPWSRQDARTWFAKPFDETHSVPRTVGREAEFPVVSAETGELVELVRLMPRILDRISEAVDAAPIVDEYGAVQRLCGARGDRWACFIEGGRGTVEITAGPARSMFELAEIMQPVLAALHDALEGEGAALLGYGMQPLTPHDRSTILPRERYYALADVLGDGPFSAWSITAADQAHVAVSRAEVATVVNALHAATPFVIALTANSSVFGGRSSAVASGREHLMDQSGDDRHGMTPTPLRGIDDYVDLLLDQPMLFLRDAHGRPRAFGGQSLAELISARPDLDGARLLDDQDHYSWANARPRRRFSTVEYRPCCQQPQDASWLPTALTIGIVERAQQVLELMLSEGDWPALRQARRRAIAEGMSSLAERADAVERFLAIVADGLTARGLGEDVLLQPAYERLATMRGPADEARALHAAGGVPALVRSRAYRRAIAVVR